MLECEWEIVSKFYFIYSDNGHGCGNEKGKGEGYIGFLEQ